MNNLVKKQSTGLVKYTKEQFVKEYAPRVCMKTLHLVNTVELAIKSNLSKLSKVSFEYGREFAVYYIQLWLIDLNEFFNLSNAMSADQIADTAELIYQDNYHLNLADINLVFTGAKKGQYGEIYGSLHGSKILKWFADYRAKRMDICFEKELHEHEVLKKHGHKSELHGLEKVLKLYGQLQVNDGNGNKVTWVWDYANNKPCKKSEMTDEEFVASEKAKWEKSTKIL
jgi:hypothetical protein